MRYVQSSVTRAHQLREESNNQLGKEMMIATYIMSSSVSLILFVRPALSALGFMFSSFQASTLFLEGECRWVGLALARYRSFGRVVLQRSLTPTCQPIVCHTKVNPGLL
jgi:hypothetical protein